MAFYDILPAPFRVYIGCDYFNSQNVNFGLNITAAVILDPTTLHHLSSSLNCNLRQLFRGLQFAGCDFEFPQKLTRSHTNVRATSLVLVSLLLPLSFGNLSLPEPFRLSGNCALKNLYQTRSSLHEFWEGSSLEHLNQVQDKSRSVTVKGGLHSF